MIVIANTVEHEDGSATYTFDIDDASRKRVTELGLELILICAAYGLDIQDALDLISREGKLKQNQSEEAK
jgi:D-arabinose 1-dehydrogenase-like Zn-dependent alcohol dehydrogenase